MPTILNGYCVSNAVDYAMLRRIQRLTHKLNLELLVHYRSLPKGGICLPSVRHHVRLSVRPLVSSSDHVYEIISNTIKVMWMKPGMRQYVDYARIC